MQPRPGSRLAVGAFTLLTLLSVSACSSSSNSGPVSTGTTTAPRTATQPTTSMTGSRSPTAATMITINNFAFTVSGPAAAGSAVRVSNTDSTAHTVTADSGSSFNVTVQPGASATFTAPGKAGTYKFHCSFHSDMHGTLTVTG
jgi:plastocyanin